jgi:hypothetical protein
LIEGIADQSNYGFAVGSGAELVSAASPLALISQISPDGIFGNYSMKRESLLQAILNDRVVVGGLWKETIFPALQDLVRYGATSVMRDS